MAHLSIFVPAGLALCFGCFGQGGIVSAPAPRQQTPLANALSHMKLIEDFTSFHQGASTAPVQPRTFIQRRKPIFVMAKAPQVLAGGSCAHIILKIAPPNVDPKLVIGVPPGGHGRISVLKGLPQCLEDVR